MIMFKKIFLYSYAYTDPMDGRTMVDRACDSRESHGFGIKLTSGFEIKGRKTMCEKVTRPCIKAVSRSFAIALVENG